MSSMDSALSRLYTHLIRCILLYSRTQNSHIHTFSNWLAAHGNCIWVKWNSLSLWNPRQSMATAIPKMLCNSPQNNISWNEPRTNDLKSFWFTDFKIQRTSTHKRNGKKQQAIPLMWWCQYVYNVQYASTPSSTKIISSERIICAHCLTIMFTLSTPILRRWTVSCSVSH